MVDLELYRENARQHNICKEYSDRWDSCKSKKQLMDMALSASALDFLFNSIAKGWGISTDWLTSNLDMFLNGRYVADQNGYTSKMYCAYKGDIYADTTLIAIIDCEANIHIPSYAICEVYCVGKCRLNVTGAGQARFLCYGSPDDIVINNNCPYMSRENK